VATAAPPGAAPLEDVIIVDIIIVIIVIVIVVICSSRGVGIGRVPMLLTIV